MPTSDADELTGRRVVFLSWRDTRNPEGGGAERYLEKVAAGLVERGCSVTIFCVAHSGAAPDETIDGIRFVRRGTKLSVYARGMWALLRRELGPVDVVVDVQNGLPFFSRLVTRRPVVVLVHHVHREQWPVVYPGLTGRFGWWVERRLAPWVYRRDQYVAVSRATRAELRGLGVTGPRVAVVHNGTDPVVPVEVDKSPAPTVCVVGRLVPHKQVEHAIDAAAELAVDHPDLRLRIVGSGWWEGELHDHARALVERGIVVFEGHVSEVRKQEIYAESWVMALPSLKEGWGLVVGEAAAHGTPTVAYADAGGTRESIIDGVSGLLADDRAGFTAALRAVLEDAGLRRRLADGALRHSEGFTWGHSQSAFAHVVAAAIRGELVTDQDLPEEGVRSAR
ncbi:glycosyltransferase [Nocardioides soli]|uniref:Glycosyltransferase involved in cell wall biosynthesis n=1 Tax=Nocardioides soli TaxID=1036020 RepID=A0A7W4VR64_9ACTN|nr:glycosyltransferase involved in cell wall biosynthesis [Nocardioides soli]